MPIQINQTQATTGGISLSSSYMYLVPNAPIGTPNIRVDVYIFKDSTALVNGNAPLSISGMPSAFYVPVANAPATHSGSTVLEMFRLWLHDEVVTQLLALFPTWSSGNLIIN